MVLPIHYSLIDCMLSSLKNTVAKSKVECCFLMKMSLFTNPMFCGLSFITRTPSNSFTLSIIQLLHWVTTTYSHIWRNSFVARFLVPIKDKYLQYMRQLLPCCLTVYELHELSRQADTLHGFS
jgi:hypothetical protein